ncbi:restriction endonuclease FokI C-terminal domain-containing protein [Enterococcus hirae]|uniref:restriction endonuclease FokI C-terminal domain-containing protein n=1 Tax=Enterococcus hirae TaxID=1354 RepID=UPI000F70E27B|nr:restriction endonuclease FokI C-terminal domain-containing protein [Enterococcus hirae]VEE81583.1 Type-2 restriction enzyme FokI [Enterococcus hirae]
MHIRTYGWVQNPSDFTKLKLVVQIFDNSSAHYQRLKNTLVNKYIPFMDVKTNLMNKLNSGVVEFTYPELVGSSKDKNGISVGRKRPDGTTVKRADAVADGLIQVTIEPQSTETRGKFWTDNWTSDGYLRWALSLNFLKHDRDTDICTITELGKKFSKSLAGSAIETNLLRDALLAYPPATQVLNILNTSSKPVTKFYIGNRLGFPGEKGFTSYDESLMLEWFRNGSKKELEKIKSDIEGTSDKYARMICTWLEKVGFVTKHTNYVITAACGKRAGFQTYSATARGLHAFKQAHGSSKNTRTEKYLTWEFLAVEGKNRNYIRSRRAQIIKFLQETSSFTKILEKLKQLGFNDEPQTIENDIIGLNTFGLRIEKNGNDVILKDKVLDFSIPQLNLTKELKDAALEHKKVQFQQLTQLPMKYIELLEIAYDGKRNRDFEILTADLFKYVYGFESILLGGGRKPDGLIFTDKFGVIIDTKAYSQGYGKSINQEDEMVRYIEDNQQRDETRNSVTWWDNFDDSIPDDSFYFLWVSSKFNGNFQEQLTSTHNRTGINGGAINVEQLLIGAAKVSKGQLDISTLPSYMDNKEIIW